MSTKHNASPIDPLEEHLVNLLDELQLSGKWRRPSILLATYNSRLTFMDARLSLENKLRKRRQNVVHIVITPENYDILLHLSQIPAREKKIFFISGLMHGGGSNDLNAFRALNMRRELLVDHRLRAVFWLSEAEASTLTAHAVDFWAFRHRMFELQDQTSPERILKLVNDLDWSHWDAPTLLKESSAGVLLREELLAELPSAWDQTPRLKAQLLLMLAGLAWSQGNSARAAVLLQQGQQLAETLNQLPLLARFRLAAGQVQQLGGSLDLAVATYQQALERAPQSAEAWRLLGLAYHAQKATSQAQAALEKSIQLDPKAAWTWSDLGDWQRDNQLIDEAIQSYQQSLTRNSKNAGTWGKLGAMYRLQGKTQAALQPYLKMKQLDLKDPNSWITLAGIYRDLGLIAQAIRAFYKITRLQPFNPLPWQYLGKIYQARHRLQAARKAYKTALSLEPDNQELLAALKNCFAPTTEK